MTNSEAFLQSITFPGTRDYVRSILVQSYAYRPDFPASRPQGSR